MSLRGGKAENWVYWAIWEPRPIRPSIVALPKATQKHGKPYMINDQGLRYTNHTQLGIKLDDEIHKVGTYTIGPNHSFCPLPPPTLENQQAPLLGSWALLATFTL